jgi:uncharacterized UPF0160 family protein
MDKERLEVNIAALQLLVNETTDKSKDFTAQLEQAKKDLADVNKPELTPLQFDDLYEAIERGIGEYDFSGKVTLESFDINNSQELVEAITDKVNKLFAEKLDTTEDDNHPVENLQN